MADVVSITVNIILTGLIAVTGADGEGAMTALVLQGPDGDHVPRMLLMEGNDCFDKESKCVQWFDREPNKSRYEEASRFALRWRLDEGGFDGVVLKLAPAGGRPFADGKVTIQPGRPRGGNGDPVALPVEADHVRDLSWASSLRGLANRELKGDCVSGKADCGVLGRFSMPRASLAGTCHLTHLPNYFLPPANACDNLRRPVNGEWVNLYAYADANGAHGKAQAVGDAVKVSFPVQVSPLGLDLVAVPLDGGDPVTLVNLRPAPTGPKQGVITLLLVNDPLDYERKFPTPADLKKPHHHFQAYYRLLDGEVTRKWMPRAMDLDQRVYLAPGWCEPFLQCADKIFHENVIEDEQGLETLYRRAVDEGYDKYLTFMVPHALSQCDVATYP